MHPKCEGARLELEHRIEILRERERERQREFNPRMHELSDACAKFKSSQYS